MIDWAKIGRAETHPVRQRILEQFDHSIIPLSPVMLRGLVGADLSTVAYHVKALAVKGILEAAGTRPSRGATEHFYVVAEGFRKP